MFAGFGNEPSTSQPNASTKQPTTAQARPNNFLDAFNIPPTPTGNGLASTGPKPNLARTTTNGEHDDPILKHLTAMGYSRTDSVEALEKYDYNLDKVSSTSF